VRYISFDPDRCVGCQACQLVCSAVWQGVFNPFKARLRVEQKDWYGVFEVSVCRQHRDAPCAEACPTGALYADEKRGLVAFDRKKCDGCGLCVEACPEKAIFTHGDEPWIFKCHLCGGGKIQQCVEACPRQALAVEEDMV